LLHKEKEILKKQQAMILSALNVDFPEFFEKLACYADSIKPHMRLPLINMVLPALRGLSEEQYDRFKATLHELIQADNKIDLFEYCLYRIVIRHLEPVFRKQKPSPIKYYAVQGIREEVAELMSHIALLGHADLKTAECAFENAAAVFKQKNIVMSFVSAQGFNLSRVDQILKVTALAGPDLKKLIITACARCVLFDKQITTDEYELLRAIADHMGCPMPLVAA
ncbi:MAG: hypothetical protein HQM16_10510, partial [Deltaproteobacteria bacterium]|nr:hypothetical protein [Deltaproteobacteria bacterium]